MAELHGIKDLEIKIPEFEHSISPRSSLKELQEQLGDKAQLSLIESRQLLLEFEKHTDVEKIPSISVEVISSKSESQSTIKIELDDV